MANDPAERFLTRREVMAILGIRPTTFAKMLAAGEIERPIIVTGTAQRWPKSQIDRFVRDRISAARPADSHK